jgi:hypothetical protein
MQLLIFGNLVLLKNSPFFVFKKSLKFVTKKVPSTKKYEEKMKTINHKKDQGMQINTIKFFNEGRIKFFLDIKSELQ